MTQPKPEHLGPDDRIHRDALKKLKDKRVPLVIYKSGERIVIGQAIVKGDGSIEGQIAKDVRKEIQHLIFGDALGALSFDPKAQPDMKYHTSTYVATSTKEPIEVAVIPPVKFSGVIDGLTK